MEGKKQALPKWALALVVGVASVGGFVASKYVVQGLFSVDKDDEVAIEKALREVSADMNKDLPTLIDSQTRLDSTSAGPGKRFTYRYTILAWNGQLSRDQFVEIMRPRTIQNYRTSVDMEWQREMGVALNYSYYDETNAEIASFEISPTDF